MIHTVLGTSFSTTLSLWGRGKDTAPDMWWASNGKVKFRTLSQEVGCYWRLLEPGDGIVSNPPSLLCSSQKLILEVLKQLQWGEHVENLPSREPKILPSHQEDGCSWCKDNIIEEVSDQDVWCQGHGGDQNSWEEAGKDRGLGDWGRRHSFFLDKK